MSNHIHLVAIPQQPNSLAAALEQVHGRYAAYFNALHLSSGHVWQGRFYSCPLDPPHLWAALRYTELNPVRAGLVTEPEAFPWSSAAVHCAPAAQGSLLDLSPWCSVWNSQAWREFLAETVPVELTAAIRQNTRTGRPLGSPGFVRGLEFTLRRRLTPDKGGRPPKDGVSLTQQAFSFGQD
jgi:putative transposase